MKPDPPIDEIRRIRHEISAEHGHDPRRILNYYASLQDRLRDRLVDHGESPIQESTKTYAKAGE